MIKTWLRVSTLLCFFSFSGLNNGFTYFIVSSGQVQRLDVSHALIERLAVAVNPVRVQSEFIHFAKHFFVSKPARVIEFASQRAVQNFMLQSSVLHTWLALSCGKLISVPAAPSALSAEKPSSAVQVSNVPARSNPTGTAIAAMNAGQTHSLNSLQETLEASRKQDLVLKRQNGGAHSAEDTFSMHRRKKFEVPERSDSRSAFTAEKLRKWLTSSLSRGGGAAPEPSISVSANSTPITLSASQGDFLFIRSKILADSFFRRLYRAKDFAYAFARSKRARTRRACLRKNESAKIFDIHFDLRAETIS